MAEGHGWGGASRADSNHPAPACASAAPPYPRRGVLLVLMSPCIAPRFGCLSKFQHEAAKFDTWKCLAEICRSDLRTAIPRL
jgi:hypothetical protein